MADKLSRTVFLKNLGKITYKKAFAIQKELVRGSLDCLKLNKQKMSRNTLIICEHYPVYTVGIQNKKDTTFHLNERQRLLRLGADFEFTNRGGLTTFHGPGQLVCYPVLNLAYFRKSVKWYVEQLERTLIETCRRFDLTAGTTSDTGVWIDDNKIAAIGEDDCQYYHISSEAIRRVQICTTQIATFGIGVFRGASPLLQGFITYYSGRRC